jgi:hypothetical protein
MTTLADRDSILRNPRYRKRILSQLPELRVDPLPPLDALIVAFLAKHDVFVSPVGSNISPTALTSGALAGAVGPGWAVANAHITQQKKAAALQEWTSWKQWALTQPAFEEFKANTVAEHAWQTAQADELWSIPETQERVRELIAESDRQDAAERALQNRMVWVGLGLFSLLAAFVAVSDYLVREQQPKVPVLTEQMPQSPSPAPTSELEQLLAFRSSDEICVSSSEACTSWITLSLQCETNLANGIPGDACSQAEALRERETGVALSTDPGAFSF